MQWSKNHHSYKDFFMGAVIGGTLGAMSALLFGTKKGRAMQKEIAHKYHEMNHNAEELIKHFMKKKPVRKRKK